MRIRKSGWIGGIAVVAVLGGGLLTVPAWAAPAGQADEPLPNPYAAMHEACDAGSAQGMADAMGSLTAEDWAGMEGHMGDDGHHEAMGDDMTGEDWAGMEGHVGDDGHHEAMGDDMMGIGGMMGGWGEASNMMDW